MGKIIFGISFGILSRYEQRIVFLSTDLLFTAQIISLLGSGVTTVELALFAYQLTVSRPINRFRAMRGSNNPDLKDYFDSLRANESFGWHSQKGLFVIGQLCLLAGRRMSSKFAADFTERGLKPCV